MPQDVKELVVNEYHPLFDRTGLFYKEFPSDFRKIRYFTLFLVQKAPPEIKEINLLEQQISEIIKNAVKHGNRNNPEKVIRIWYSFSTSHAHLVVEDEGEGFQGLEEWNAFNLKRHECFRNQDSEQIQKYVSFRTPLSEDHDGGNALFAAVEYWSDGVIFSNKRNSVAVGKTFFNGKVVIDSEDRLQGQ